MRKLTPREQESPAVPGSHPHPGVAITLPSTPPLGWEGEFSCLDVVKPGLEKYDFRSLYNECLSTKCVQTACPRGY